MIVMMMLVMVMMLMANVYVKLGSVHSDAGSIKCRQQENSDNRCLCTT